AVELAKRDPRAVPHTKVELAEREPRLLVLRLQAGRLAQQAERLPEVTLELLGEGLDEDRLDRQRLHGTSALGERDSARVVGAERVLRLSGPAAAEPDREERGERSECETGAGERSRERRTRSLDRLD